MDEFVGDRIRAKIWPERPFQWDIIILNGSVIVLKDGKVRETNNFISIILRYE